MPRVLKSRTSREDYLTIWLHIARDNPTAADRLTAEFDRLLDVLSETPLIGRSEEHHGPGLRSFPVGQYLIFYRLTAEGIDLVRVLHAARDIADEYFLEQ